MSLNKIYRAIGISKQSVHKQLNRSNILEDEKMHLTQMIHKIRQDHPTLGCRDLYFKIMPQSMGRDKFEQFCKENGFASEKTRNYSKTTDSSGVIRFENLLANTTVCAMDQVWQSDITYYEVKGRFYYITFIIDSYTRRIVGHQTSYRLLTTHTTLPALQKAIKMRSPKNLKGLIFHSDGGGQYYASSFLDLTRKIGIQNSMCDYAWENGKAERINGVIKNNYLQHRKIESYEQLCKEVDRSVTLYNNDKPHIKLQRMTPIAFEQKILSLQEQTKPMMTESFDAKTRFSGASSPLNLNKQSLRI